MQFIKPLIREYHRRLLHPAYRSNWSYLHLDGPLLISLLLLMAFGMLIIYSATIYQVGTLKRHGIHLMIGLAALVLTAQISPKLLKHWSPFLYFLSLGFLGLVLLGGKIGKGAQRWIELGGLRFQPSEWVKLTVPMMLAWLFSRTSAMPNTRTYVIALVWIVLPVLCIVRQPDLGTGILVGSIGLTMMIGAGLAWRWVWMGLGLLGVSLPLLWNHLHPYQKQRVLTLLNPERDPLGSGYHIIQSKIAIGSGGIWGKGWLQGSQTHLDFLPEHKTDFIFAVCAEEFGFIGCLLLLVMYGLICFRTLYLANLAKTSYNQLLIAGLGLTFFICAVVNIGMVTGLLPVVGVPLPLVSYGGSSILSLCISFGIIMAVHHYRS